MEELDSAVVLELKLEAFQLRTFAWLAGRVAAHFA